MVSRLELIVDGEPPRLLGSQRDGAWVSHQVFAVAYDPFGSPTALLHRRREIGAALVDHYRLTTFEEGLQVRLSLRYEHDFADVLSVKQGKQPPAPVAPAVEGPGWVVGAGRFSVAVVMDPQPAELGTGAVAWDVELDAGDSWTATVTHMPQVDGVPVAKHEIPAPSTLRVDSSATSWRLGVASALADRDALRVVVPDMDLAYIGAGVPWFMALFGRDTLITALSSLIAGTDAGLDVAESLAHYQGTRHDPRTGEQPGRMLHELRTGGAEVFGLPVGTPHYGTVDATPLFVMLLGELHRWGADADRVQALLPAARAAVDWCLDVGDVDGDGFVEYVPDPDGLANQGWKDSGDSMVHADGRMAEGPIALAEVQAYTWAALRDLAEMEERIGDPARAEPLRSRADALRSAFHASFWLPEEGILAMALDGAKEPLAVASSNMGHCLWAGICDDEVGGLVADRLGAPDMRTAWGIRTLAASEVAYSPLSYHRGSVWPHDSAICAAGLMRYGRTSLALEVVDGLLAAAEHFGWRLPELIGGQDAEEVSFPVPYPVACSPQAWSASVPLGLLRLVLGLDPDVPAGRVRLAPVLPAHMTLDVQGVDLGVGLLSMRVADGTVANVESPPGLRVEPGQSR